MTFGVFSLIHCINFLSSTSPFPNEEAANVRNRIRNSIRTSASPVWGVLRSLSGHLIRRTMAITTTAQSMLCGDMTLVPVNQIGDVITPVSKNSSSQWAIGTAWQWKYKESVLLSSYIALAIQIETAYMNGKAFRGLLHPTLRRVGWYSMKWMNTMCAWVLFKRFAEMACA